jgi:ADP-ribose pyrophosphatase YjhB (NUDIX family)
VDPGRGEWSLYGGFVRSDESLDDAAHRTLRELTGLRNVFMRQVGAFGNLDRDPGERVVSVAYYALINVKDYSERQRKQHDVEWVNIEDIPQMYSDHNNMVVKARKLMKQKIKTDPVGFESAWLSANGKYLNLGLVVKLGAVDSLTQKQSVGIVGDTILTHGDGRRTYQLRLYHNQGDVPEYYSQRVYISVPVDTLDVDTLQLSVNTYSGVSTKRFKHTLKHH